MKTLIVAATYPEVSVLCEHFQLPKQELMSAEHFDVLITGVGMTATAFALGRQLNTSYDLVLNLGIAGAYLAEIPLGTVLQINEDTFSELGAESGSQFIPIDELGFGKSTFNEILPPSGPIATGLRAVRGITVNRVHGNRQSIQQIQERLDPATESMEGAAVFMACKRDSIPCLQIRSISNYVEERNTGSWNIPLAISMLNLWAIRFLTIA